MASTAEILDHCARVAGDAIPHPQARLKPYDAALYCAHVGTGASMRALAGAAGCSPSTVCRAIRRVEARRDDPLVDDLFDRLGAALAELLSGSAPGTVQTEEFEVPRNNAETRVPGGARALSAADRDARRVLRRLAEPDAFLVVARGAEAAGVFCRTNDFRKPLAMISVANAQRLAAQDWIECSVRGAATARYRITQAGRSWLKRQLASEVEERRRVHGFAEAATLFAHQHQERDERVIADPDPAAKPGAAVRLRVNLGESPLGWLAKRRGPDGGPFLNPEEVEAGERLREDFELAQIGPSVAQDWRRFLTPGDRGGAPGRTPSEGPMGARDRVAKALDALGPGLADAALRACCFLEGLETTERRMGWSARSAKVVLKIALTRLAEHYGIAAAPVAEAPRKAG